MKADIAATGTSRRGSSSRPGRWAAGGWVLRSRAMTPSSAPVASTAPATTYSAAIVTGASFEKPARAAVVLMTPGATKAATAHTTATGADIRAVASTPTRAITTARVYQACQATAITYVCPSARMSRDLLGRGRGVEKAFPFKV